jgi:hypothetical protein
MIARCGLHGRPANRSTCCILRYSAQSGWTRRRSSGGSFVRHGAIHAQNHLALLHAQHDLSFSHVRHDLSLLHVQLFFESAYILLCEFILTADSLALLFHREGDV